MKKTIAMAAFVWLAFTVNAFAATFDVRQNEEFGAWIVMDGETVDGDLERFERALTQAKRTGVFNNDIFLAGPGGLRHVGVAIAERVREERLTTLVWKKDSCASACAMIWMAGWERLSWKESKIGFHFGFLQTETLKEIQDNHGFFGLQHILKDGAIEDTLFFVDMGIKDRDGFFEEMSLTPHMWWSTPEQRVDLIGSHVFN